jgi:DNA repair exonuclease SbcCD ATPase subunit
MSKEQFEHLKSTLAKIHDLTPMLENLELKDEEKDESIKIYNQKQVNIITEKLDKIKRSMTTKDEQINKNNSLISEYREKINDLESKLQNIQNETYGNEDWKKKKKEHDAEIENLKGKEIKEDENGNLESTAIGGFVVLSSLAIGLFLGYTTANYLFPSEVSFGELIDDLTNGSWLFWCTCCSVPMIPLAIGVNIDVLLSKRHNLRIYSEIDSKKAEYNKKYFTTSERLSKIENEINDYNRRISGLESTNKSLKHLPIQQLNFKDELVRANNNLAKIDKEEKRILKMKTDLNKEIESLIDEIKHLIPHSEKF